MHTVDEPAAPPAKRVPPSVVLFRYACWAFSGLLLAFATACFWQRFDACTVVTLFPTWCWAGLGLIFAGFSFSVRRYWPSVMLAVGWSVFLVLLSDTPSSFLRAMTPAPQRSAIRVVSLNCSNFIEAARNVAQFDPDIVLLQESPRAQLLAPLAEKMYGPGEHIDSSYDPAILTRGEITIVNVPAAYRDNFVHARVEIAGSTIDVISLRLYRCPIRIDFWSPDCWRYYQANRESRRRQLEHVAHYVETLPSDTRIILGGDFNCPPHDAVFDLLKPRLSDAFAVAGRGWGATIIAIGGWQTIRIDQIWTSHQIHATNVFAHNAAPSDHDMMVADFSLDEPQK